MNEPLPKEVAAFVREVEVREGGRNVNRAMRSEPDSRVVRRLLNEGTLKRGMSSLEIDEEVAQAMGLTQYDQS